MKKALKILFVAVFVCCLVVYMCGLTACDDAVKEVYVSCCQGDGMKLPVKFEKAWAESHGTAFKTSQSLESIAAEVNKFNKKGEAYSARVYGDNYIFIEKTLNGGDMHYYLVTRTQSGVYAFTSLWQKFDFDGKIVSVLVPYHFLQIQKNGSSAEHICGVTLKSAYKTSASPEETAEFYKRKNLFRVTVLNDAVYVAANGYTLEAVLKTIDNETFITFNLQ